MAANLNKYNFLRWFDGCDNVDSNAIPRIFVKDLGACYPILLYPGERTSFYLNFNLDVNYTFTVFLMQDNVKVGSSLCTLTQLTISTGVYEYYGQFTCPSVANGYYRLGLYSGSDLMAVSNVLEVTRDISKSVYVRFRHGKQMYGYNYNLIPSFYNEFRLNIYEADKQVDYNMDQYRSVSSNKLRNYDKHVDRFWKFETYYFDEGAHEACEIMIAHDEIYINTKKFLFKEGYKPNLDPAGKLSKGEFQLYEEQYSIDSKSDNTAIVSLSVIYYNTEQSGTYRKNNCPEGYVGSEVTYTVKAGSYCSMVSQAAANNLALAEITANGQAYANAHGTCTEATLIYEYYFDNLDNLSFNGYPEGWSATADGHGHIVVEPGGAPSFVQMNPQSGGGAIILQPGNYRLNCTVVSKPDGADYNQFFKLNYDVEAHTLNSGVNTIDFTATQICFGTFEFRSSGGSQVSWVIDDVILNKLPD